MTAVAAVAARTLSPFGRHPTTVVAGHVSRRAARSGLVWGAVFAVYVTAQTFGYTSGYKTQAARDQFAKAYDNNIGINALIGPARSLNTVAGYASWRLLGLLSLLGGIWGLLTSTRLLRGEEEAGLTEMLLAGQTTRRRATGQALSGLGAGLVALFVLTAVATVLTGRAPSVGFSLGGSLYLSVTLIAGAATFLAVGAFASQLASTRRRAASMAGAVFGVAYALRMVADSQPGLHWLVWLSPLGWIEESRPLTSPHPVALLPVLAFVAILAAITVHLAGTRDVGGSTLLDRETSEPHLALLANPTALAARLIRPVAIGWLFAVVAFSILIGSVAESSTKDAAGSTAIQHAIGRLGGHGSLVNTYLGLTFILIALLIGLIAAGQISAIRTEEGEGRLETLVVRPVSRIRWFAGRLGLSTVLLVVAGVLAGIGAWAGAASQHSRTRFGPLVVAGLNVVPPSLFMLGLGALVFGLWPRRTAAVVYGYLAWSFLIEFLGAVVHASHWLMDTSIYFHMVPAPATTPNWASATVVTTLGIAGGILGTTLFTRRDTTGA